MKMNKYSDNGLYDCPQLILVVATLLTKQSKTEHSWQSDFSQIVSKCNVCINQGWQVLKGIS